MKKVNNLFMLLAAIMALSVTSARSETVSEYHCNFDTSIDTSDHAFQVASNWGHKVDSYNAKETWGNYDYFVDYKYYSGAGVDGSYALKAGSQNIGFQGDWWGTPADLKDVNDLLITPPANGTISLAVKKTADAGNVKFFAVGNDGTFDSTAPLKTVTSDELTTTDYTTVTFEVDDFTKIGIRAENVYIDDFKASQADIVPEKKMRIVSFDPNVQSGYTTLYQNAEKKIQVTYKVVVENIGDTGADLKQDDDGYSISLVSESGFVIATVPVPQDLAVDETSEEFTVTGYIDDADISKVWSYSTANVRINLREDLKGAVTNGSYYMYKKYEPVFYFRVKDAYSASNLTQAQSFGILNDASTKEYEVFNDGGAPLVIKSIAIGGGFTVTPSEGFTVEPGAKTYVNVTMPADPGSYDGDLTLVWVDKDNADQTYTLHFNGKVLAEGTWSTEFISNNYQSGYPEGSVAQSGVTTSYNYQSGSYNHYLTNQQYATEENNKFITPKLHVEAGDKMSFDVKKATGSTNNIKVYLSTDRVNWGEPVANLDIASADYETKEITAAEAGDYYVAFALNGVYLDNLAGFKKVDVAHDLYITGIQSGYSESTNVNAQNAETVNIKVQLIPVLAASKNDYTVKLCIRDEEGNATETDVESKDLTASAMTISAFTKDYTFDVTKSCVLKAYFVFTFTDGTEYVSPELTYNISHEPDFLFVNKDKLGYKNRPDSETAAIDFGKANEAVENADFAIWNWGTADLTLTSVEASENFTVNALDPMTLKGKEYRMLTLGFNPDATGSYEGTLTVKYLDAAGAEQTFTIALTGTKLDSNKWFAGFGSKGSEAWPAGSLHESYVMLASDYNTNNSFARAYNYDTNNLFTTPKLRAEAGETLEFSARKYSAGNSINVYVGATREELNDLENRTPLITFENLDNTAFETKQITFAEAGEYYIGFALKGVEVDDIYGLELVPVAHDIQIASVSIPATGMQNVASSVTVNLRNFGLNPETDYEIVLHIGDEVFSVKPETEIPVMNTTTDAPVSLTLNMQSPKPGTFPVYVEFKAGDYTLASESQDVEFAEETAGGEMVIGKFLRYTDQVPVTNYWRHSESVMIITPDELGISQGDKISNISFKGYYNASARTSDVKVYVSLVDDLSIEQPAAGPYPKTGLTEVFGNDSYQWPIGGSYNNSIDILKSTLSTPLVYEAGKSLLIVVESHTADPYYNPAVQYELADVSGKCYYVCEDTSAAFETKNWDSSYRPVIYLTVEANPAVATGNVADAEANAVEGATVTFVSEDGDNVQYQGTTDAEGKFSVNIVQSSRTYTVTAEKDGLKDMKEGVTADNMADLSFILTKWIELNEEDANLPAESTTATVLVDINREAGYHAVAFPVTLSDNDLKTVFGSDVETFTFEGMSGNTAWFKPSTQTEFAAGVPILVKTYAPSQRVVLEAAREVSNVANKIDKDGYSFEATYAPRALAAGEFILSEQNWKPNNESPETPAALSNEIPTVRAYQAVLRAQDPENAPEAISFVTSDNNPVGIENMIIDGRNAEIYNLQGIRVYNPEPGIYIVDGKKVLISK